MKVQVDKQEADSITDFVICYNYIEQVVSNAAKGSEFFIVFFTDGKDTENSRTKTIVTLRNLRLKLKKFNREKGINTTIYCIGFRPEHDAALLNEMAQSGSQMGNFIYVDTYLPGYEKLIDDALKDSLSMATDDFGKPRMQVRNPNSSFRILNNCETIYGFEKDDEDVLDPQSVAKDKNWE